MRMNKKYVYSFTALAASGLLAVLLAGCNGSNGANIPSGGGTHPTPAPSGAPTQYVQIELLSRPAVKELFEKFVDHQITNGIEPYNDPTLQGEIQGLTDALRPPNASLGSDYGKALASILYPNEYAVDLSQNGKAAYLGVETGGATGGKFGGRGITDDVVDISLGAVFGHTLAALGVQPEDNEENNCLTVENVKQSPTQRGISHFPYLSGPH
jgi:Domain of unknown function (DUF4331)